MSQPSPPSLIWGSIPLPPSVNPFRVDPALVQDSKYRFNKFDRGYIDSQILGCETHLVQSVLGGASCTWAMLDPGSAAAVPGLCVVLAGTSTGTVTKATAATLLAAGSIFGVCMSAASPGGWVRIALGGWVPPSISQLPTSGNQLYAKVNAATGFVTSTALLLSTDYAIGTIDSAGNLNVRAGLAGGAGSSNVVRVSAAGPIIAVPGATSVYLTGMTLTDMTGGIAGQQICITLKNAGAVVNHAGASGTSFVLSGSANCTAVANYSTLDVVYEPTAGGTGAGAWCERARSTDNG